MSDYDLGDDEELMAALAETIDATEPLPSARVDEIAAQAFASRAQGTELANPMRDSAEDVDKVSDAATRHLVFGLGQVHFELYVDHADPVLTGSVHPTDVICTVETADDSTAVELDEFGRFGAVPLNRRFRVLARHQGRVVATPWVFI